MAEGVLQYKDLTLVFENTIACSFFVSTDMPGGTMTTRRTLTIPVTTSRTERTFSLDYLGLGLVDGKLIQFLATPSGVLKLYAGSIRFRKIGEYIDGTVVQPDIWQTQALALG